MAKIVPSDDWDGETISIKGKDKAEVLAALYNGCKNCRRQMSKKEAQQLLDGTTGVFDQIDGNYIKMNLKKDEVWTVLYDQYNGKGACRKALTEAGLI